MAWAPLADGRSLDLGASSGAGLVVAGQDELRAEVVNNTQAPLRVELYLTAAGLDGRVVTRKLGKVTLAGLERRLVPVRVQKLPIQSAESDAWVAIEAEISRPEGVLRTSPEPVHYRFDPEYTRAAVWSSEGYLAALANRAGDAPSAASATTMASARPAALADLSRISGRLVAEDGKIVDAAVAANRDAVAPRPSGGASQGLTMAEFLLVDRSGDVAVVSGDPAHPGLAAPVPSLEEVAPGEPLASDALASPVVAAAPVPTTRVCSHWKVSYVDAGFGTDSFTTTGYYNEPARFAKAYVFTSGGSPLWSGHLDDQGCTPILALPSGSYALQQNTLDVAYAGVHIDNVRHYDGYYYVSQLSTGFTIGATPPSYVYLYPITIFPDIHSAAISGQILLKQRYIPNFGVPDGYYDIITNENCPNTGYDACGGYPASYIGPTLKYGGYLYRWRFIVAHEFGHAVQFRAGAMPFDTYNNPSDTNLLCQCEHVTSASKAHCLQSREQSTAAQVEGFAHAFATRVFNITSQANGTFVYYKEFKDIGLTVQPPPLARDAYSFRRWHENRCNTLNYQGVEWDWLTFFFHLTNTSALNETTFPELYEIYKAACHNPSGSSSSECDDAEVTNWVDDPDVSYDGSLRDAAEQVLPFAKFVRFRATGENWGVDH